MRNNTRILDKTNVSDICYQLVEWISDRTYSVYSWNNKAKGSIIYRKEIAKFNNIVEAKKYFNNIK